MTHTDGGDQVRIGAWHILPKSLVALFRPAALLKNIPDDAMTNMTLPLEGIRNEPMDENAEAVLEAKELVRTATDKGAVNVDKLFEDALRKVPGKVVLYMHGNSGHRGAGHRVELYQLLQKLDCHVIAFDYRSYGDSSSVECSEFGLVNDALAMYRYNSLVSSYWGQFDLISFLSQLHQRCDKQSRFRVGSLLGNGCSDSLHVPPGHRRTSLAAGRHPRKPILKHPGRGATTSVLVALPAPALVQLVDRAADVQQQPALRIGPPHRHVPPAGDDNSRRRRSRGAIQAGLSAVQGLFGGARQVVGPRRVPSLRGVQSLWAQVPLPGARTAAISADLLQCVREGEV